MGGMRGLPAAGIGPSGTRSRRFARCVHDSLELWQNSPPESGTTKASGALNPRSDRAPLLEGLAEDRHGQLICRECAA
jgi:hypothetical protein